MIDALCVHDILIERARRSPEAVLHIAPGRRAGLTCRDLLGQSEKIANVLNGWGLGRGNRICTFLPGGPETASLMLAINCCATYAPLDPRLTVREAEAALIDMKARAIILQKGVESAGRAAAEKCGTAIIEMSFDPDAPAGLIELSCERPPQRENPHGSFAQPDDLFYVLQTSGTTARPKLVPLTQRSFCLTFSNVGKFVGMSPQDRGIHILTMSNVMGIAIVLHSVMSGASVIYAPGFYTAQFFAWVREFLPTWFTAPPAIHQTVVQHAADHLDFLRQHPLRLLRSGAAPLSVALVNQIEHVWQAPMVESYGMSECPIITSNHMPPGPRKIGSIGRPCGVEVALLDATNQMIHQSSGSIGEILVRGPHLMSGYENNPTANAAAFLDGWFRTGDLARFDDEGFLYSAGRRNELINRGGVKIAPREIDEAILEHPAIADAVTFALPDDRLGEDVAVAAVLKSGAAATELEIRQFASARLSQHKVPRKVVFVDELPLGAMGKPRRIGMAQMLGLKQQPISSPAQAPFIAPRTPLEEALAAIWESVLGLHEPVSVNATFMDLGGDSLGAVAMFAELQRVLGRRLAVATLIAAPTIAALASAMERDSDPMPKSPLVAIQPSGRRPPLFCLPGMHGHVFNFYPLARHLGNGQPVYGLQLPLVYDRSARAASIPELAAMFIAEIRAIQHAGPYQLAGYSFGGYLAYEIAQQLQKIGEPITMLAMFDTPGPGYPRKLPLIQRLQYHARRMFTRSRDRYVMGRLSELRRRWLDSATSPVGTAIPDEHQSIAAIRSYQVRPYAGNIILFRAQQQPRWLEACVRDEQMGWGKLAAQVEVISVPGDHVSILSSAHAPELAVAMSRYLSPSSGPSHLITAEC